MSKVAPENRFFDLSDYGRPIAKFMAKGLKKSKVTAIHVTFVFLFIGLLAIHHIYEENFVLVLFLLICKSIMDAVDGELAREQKKPSYTGRYLDSIFDLVLNFLILFAISVVSKASFFLFFTAFFAIQLQGTLYNYYYTILRNNLSGGDRTSRVEEVGVPNAFPGESQRIVTPLFYVFQFLYGGFDQLVFLFDNKAKRCTHIPKWFMTFVSIYGLGFQLLIIGIMLSLGWVNLVLPFIIAYSIFIPVLILLRKLFVPC